MRLILSVLFSTCLVFSPAKFMLSVSYAQSGGWQWGQGSTISGGGFGNDAWSVATDMAGNVYCAGFNFENSVTAYGAIALPNTSTTGTCDGSGFIQVTWAKYSSTGTVLWADGTQNGDAWIFNITTDPTGNLIIFGSFDSPTLTIGATTLTNAYGAAGTCQYFIAKYSPTGTLLWAVNDGNAFNSGQGFLTDVVILGTGGVATDAAGNIYVTANFQLPTITIGGTTLTNADPSGATSDIFVAKYTPAGTLAWATRAGGNSDEFSYGITAGAGGNVYVTGAFWSSSFTNGASVISNPYGAGGYGFGFPTDPPLAYIAEFSPAGAPLWAEAAGGPNGSYGIGLVSDAAGNVYMTGAFGDASITFGGVTLNRTYPAAAPNLALYLVQFSPANVVTWKKTIGSSSASLWGFAIGLASCGEVWVSGNFTEDADIDGNILLSPTDTVPLADPVFIAGYTLAGGVIGYSALASGGDDQNGIAVDPTGNVFMGSDYESDVDFYIGSTLLSTASTTSFGTETSYIGKYATVIGAPDTTYMQQDTTLCGSVVNIELIAPVGYSAYTWNTAATTPTVTATTTGPYWVVCSSTCSIPTVIDTFHIELIPTGTTYHSSDTSICSIIGSVSISGDAGYTSYSWSTGGTTAAISISDTGTYWVSEIDGCGTRIDTTHVSYTYPVTQTSVSDTFVCTPSDVINLTGDAGYSTYAWSTGNTSSAISVSDTGSYWVTEEVGCNIQIDTFSINLASPVLAAASNTVSGCSDLVNFTALPAGPQYSYQWIGPDGFSANSQDPYITYGLPVNQGVYTLTVVDNATSCIGNATTSVVITPAPPPNLTNITPTQIIYYGSSAQLNADGVQYYWWMPNDGTISNRNINDPVVSPTQTTIYTVYGMDSSGCVDSAKILVEVIYDSVVIPSAFTPNGDGLNDIFHPLGMKNQSLIEFSIYNRWGQRIFTTNNKDQGWDGTFNGEKQDMDVYQYVLIVALDDGDTQMFKGNVTLVR